MSRQYRFNDPTHKTIRQKLRNNMPKAEIILWQNIKGKNLNNLKFRRQYGIGPFIVDFYCPSLKLAIELDGASHFDDKEVTEYDKERQFYIERCGIRFLRFTNDQIYEGLEEVMKLIREEAERSKSL